MSLDGGSGSKRSRPEAGSTLKALPDPSEVIAFLKICGKLKRTARTGWVRRGVKDFESVADHSWRMGVLSMMLAGVEGVDHTRCIKIGLVHDLAESLVGDITPHCGVSKEEKSRLEREAMQRIQDTIPDSKIGAEVVELWEEYEAAQTAEAKIMKDLDKFEMLMQAEEYEASQGVDLDEFFTSTRGKIKSEEVSSWESELRQQRNKRQAKGSE